MFSTQKWESPKKSLQPGVEARKGKRLQVFLRSTGEGVAKRWKERWKAFSFRMSHALRWSSRETTVLGTGIFGNLGFKVLHLKKTLPDSSYTREAYTRNPCTANTTIKIISPGHWALGTLQRAHVVLMTLLWDRFCYNPILQVRELRLREVSYSPKGEHTAKWRPPGVELRSKQRHAVILAPWDVASTREPITYRSCSRTFWQNFAYGINGLPLPWGTPSMWFHGFARQETG